MYGMWVNGPGSNVNNKHISERVANRVLDTDSPYSDIQRRRTPQGWLVSLNPDIYSTIRLICHQEFLGRGKPITVSDLHHRIKSDDQLEFPYGRTVLHKVLRAIGFRVRRGLG